MGPALPANLKEKWTFLTSLAPGGCLLPWVKSQSVQPLLPLSHFLFWPSYVPSYKDICDDLGSSQIIQDISSSQDHQPAHLGTLGQAHACTPGIGVCGRHQGPLFSWILARQSSSWSSRVKYQALDSCPDLLYLWSFHVIIIMCQAQFYGLRMLMHVKQAQSQSPADTRQNWNCNPENPTLKLMTSPSHLLNDPAPPEHLGVDWGTSLTFFWHLTVFSSHPGSHKDMLLWPWTISTLHQARSLQQSLSALGCPTTLNLWPIKVKDCALTTVSSQGFNSWAPAGHIPAGFTQYWKVLLL